jgi:translation elongation factor EF-4
VGLANGFFLGTLLLNIIADSLKRHDPHATDEISTVPEIRFPIKLCNMALEAVSRKPMISGLINKKSRFDELSKPALSNCMKLANAYIFGSFGFAATPSLPRFFLSRGLYSVST